MCTFDLIVGELLESPFKIFLFNLLQKLVDIKVSSYNGLLVGCICFDKIFQNIEGHAMLEQVWAPARAWCALVSVMNKLTLTSEYDRKFKI